MDFQRLLREHDEIDALCRSLIRVVGQGPADTAAILRARADLAAALGTHLAHEDSFIYPAMAARNGASAAAAAFVAEFAGLTRDWAIYLDDWSPECIVGDWATFRNETLAIVARMHVRVQRETAALYPEALRAGAITLRPPATPAI